MKELEEIKISVEEREKLYFTVKEITQDLKNLIERKFPLLWIEGEIANLRYSQNGNIYFNLIEEEASLKAIIFCSQRDVVITPYLRDGLKVLCLGKLNFYPRSGECYFIVRRAEPLGKGLLTLKKEALINKYKALFDPNRKKAIPPYPKKIALVTSIFGAALQDFLKISKDRWELEILIYPVRVQGEGAEKEIVQAVKDINTYFNDVDMIIITRGGGSFEDLAPFYTEDIILGIKDSKIPVVSAVGHEIDYTICDLIADKRCATPTAAAEEVIPSKEEILYRLKLYQKKYNQLLEIILSKGEKRLYEAKIELESRNPFKVFHNLEKKVKELSHKLTLEMEKYLSLKEKKLLEIKNLLRKRHPQETIKLGEERLKFFKNRLFYSIKTYFEKKEKKLENLGKLLATLSPLNILQRGYSIVKSYPEGKIIKSAKEVKNGELLEIYLSEGRLLVEVRRVEE
ncbi:MAG: exodeoxyribonuclease VII large subunit [Thermodesulfobacterium geofontis]|uniref:Exodeoxyribonuclease 7 large subunit n=2 Tax=Thermodesulfobacterium geofontis TaxID=1295609 RepID=A0A2N7PLR3_9BACT|nr:MAG: exodeoxyribonuclease VII large subunit [Thermodesulfobacterium geofontis]